MTRTVAYVARDTSVAVVADIHGNRWALEAVLDDLERRRQTPGGRLVVNPGSVGLPAYTHDLPYAHGMEAGSPHARYCVLGGSGSKWRVEQVAVAYDFERAARAAEARDRRDWAEWIRTGRSAGR